MKPFFPKSLPFLFMALLTSLAGISQEKRITLTVQNSRGELLNGVTLLWQQWPDSTVQRRKILKSTDSLLADPAKSYRGTLSYTGYAPLRFTWPDAGQGDSLYFILPDKNSNLGNVTVVARKPLIKQEDDKTVIDAEPLANASTNAYEVLEKTPGAITDQDGNVYLNSSTPATIFLNGRELKLSPADLAALLKSLPANSVQKIEVLRTPSAKYDASSSGGIVNIVLKKGVKIGLNGSANIAHFQGRYATETAGVNLNNNNQTLNSYFSYQYTKRNNFEDLNSDRLTGTDNNAIRQQSYTRYPGYNHYGSGGLDYQVNPKLSLGYDTRLSYNRNTSDAFNDMDILNKTTGTVLGKTISDVRNRGYSLYWGNNFSHKYKIDSTGSEWTSSIDVNFFRNRNQQNYDNYFSYPLNDTITGDGLLNNRRRIFMAQTDLVWKMPQKYTLEAGFKFSGSNSRNAADYFIVDNQGNRRTDSFQTNTFRYRERIVSTYAQVAKTFGQLTIKPGLRVEHTDISGRQEVPGDTSFSIRRTDLFPYLYIRHPLFKLFGFSLTGNLVIRRSISRPYYEALNPYPRYIDQFLFDVGNPALRPQFTNNAEFNILADQFPIFSVGYNDIRDIFTQVSYQDPVTKIVYRTFDNLGRNREFYLRFVGGIPPGKKYFFYLGGQHNLNHYQGFYQNEPLDYTRGSWVFFMYHNYRTPFDLNISVQGFMRLRGLQNFFELEPFGALNLTLNQSILKKKANIIVAVNDMFRTNRVNFAIAQPGINAQGSRWSDTRRLGITFRYNFGIKPKEDKKPEFGAPGDVNP